MMRVEGGEEEEGGRRFYWLEGEAPSKPTSDHCASDVCSIFLLTPLVENWSSLGLLFLENRLSKVVWYWRFFIIFLKWSITLSLNKLMFLLTTALSG